MIAIVSDGYSLFAHVTGGGPIAMMGCMNTITNFTVEGRPILSLHKFCEKAGISGTTAWRWRRNGWLTTVNIAGKRYLTDKALSDFIRRAEAGEFAKEPKVPNRRSAT